MRQNDRFNRRPLLGPPLARGRFGRRKALKIMKLMKTLVVLGCGFSLLAGSIGAADTPQKPQTCCQKAAAAGKECAHKCCVVAHKEGKSCEKCNPGKEDLKLIKSDKKAATSAAK